MALSAALISLSPLPVNAVTDDQKFERPEPSEGIGTRAPGEDADSEAPTPGIGETGTGVPGGLQGTTAPPPPSVSLTPAPSGPVPEPSDGYVPGRSVEIVEKRGEKQTVYRNEDGTETAIFFSRPIRVKDSKGNWQDIDTNLISSSGRFKNKRGKIGLDFAKSADDPKLQSMTFVDGSSVEFALDGGKEVDAEIGGSTIKLLPQPEQSSRCA